MCVCTRCYQNKPFLEYSLMTTRELGLNPCEYSTGLGWAKHTQGRVVQEGCGFDVAVWCSR